MKAGGLILDVGCGSGHLARLMPKLADKIPGLTGKCIYAFDIAEKMLVEAAKQQAAKITQRGDIQQIVPFVNEDKPSVAIVSYLLHYLKDPLSALRNVFSALGDGGIITIAIRRPEGESWDEEVYGLLRQAGFEPYKAKTITVTVVDQIKGDEIPVGLVYALKKS